MITSVTGRVAALLPDSAVVEVGGVGLSLQCTPATLGRLRIGEVTRLSTSMVVREESLTLYGFADDDERAVFELLQTATGVGPRLAQGVLGVHSPDALRRAIATEDVAALTRVAGIGRKGAQRIVLELKDRLGALGTVGPARAADVEVAPWRTQLHAALVGLGWSTRDADDAVQTVAPAAEAALAAGEEPDIGGLLRSALSALVRA